MWQEHEEVWQKANNLDLSKVRSEVLASTTIPDTFKQQSDNLLQEYQRFITLKVISNDTKTPLILSPSAIIDQVWHIHLLMPAHYVSCCQELGVDMIDHDPSTARDSLELRSKRLEMTKKSYQAVFQKMPPEMFWMVTYKMEPISNQRLSRISSGDGQYPLVPYKPFTVVPYKQIKPISDPGSVDDGQYSEVPNKRIKIESISNPGSSTLPTSAERDQTSENLSEVKTEFISFYVFTEYGKTIKFKARRHTKFANFFRKFAEVTNRSLQRFDPDLNRYADTMRFVFDSRRIDEHDTADSLQMIDGDFVEVYYEMAGC